MARVFKRPGDPHWWLDFTADGQRRRLKTTTTSKRAAEELLAEKRANITRVKLGLEASVSSRFSTLSDAWRHWVNHWCPAASKRREKSRFAYNVEKSWIGRVKLTELRGEQLDKWFDECPRTKKQSPSTINGHRRIARRVFNCLIRRRMFRGVNPVSETTPREEAEFAYELLTEAEFWRTVVHLPQDWQPIAIVAFVTGLRRGEIYPLRKDRNVIDLDKHTLTPRASNARSVTKGKRVKSIPLFSEGLAVLKPAWDAAASGALLFPSKGGKLRSEHLKPAEILRTAMARAGLVEGFDHRCRSRGCRGELLNERDEQRRLCPACGRVLWARPIVRQVRFHDLRHSCAVYLLDRGVDLYAVSQMLRHSSPAITAKIYAHRTVETLRSSLGGKPTPLALELALERLAAAHPEFGAELRAVAGKVASSRHQTSNVVAIRSSNEA